MQLGFVAGALTSSVLNLADRFPPHRLLAACALGAAASTVRARRLRRTGWAGAVPLRFGDGVFLAGVYPVGMKLMASWSEPVDRGRAFGILIGASRSARRCRT